MVFLDTIHSRQPHQLDWHGTRFFNRYTEPGQVSPSELRFMMIALVDHLGDNPCIRRRIQHCKFLRYPTFPRNSSSERAWVSLAEIVISSQIMSPMSRLNNSASAWNPNPPSPHARKSIKKNSGTIFFSVSRCRGRDLRAPSLQL
jgi:hypothetical protein